MAARRTRVSSTGRAGLAWLAAASFAGTALSGCVDKTPPPLWPSPPPPPMATPIGDPGGGTASTTPAPDAPEAPGATAVTPATSEPPDATPVGGLGPWQPTRDTP